MVKKAQAEFIVIVGVLLLILIVIYYATRGGPLSSNVPANVYSKQTQVQASFMSMVRKGADKTLDTMEAHGGYPTAELLGGGSYQSPNFTIFMGEGVPYWTLCDENVMPSKANVKKWFELSVKKYITDNIGELEGNYRNVSFDLSKLSVTVNIISNPRKIEITVILPTRVDGYAMQSPLYPYKASVDSKLGEIIDFASDFSAAQADKRFMEIFTTASIYMSKDAGDGYPKLPTGGILTNCGQTIYRSPDQVSAYLQEIAEYVITQMLWWQNMPVDPNKPKVYAINNEVIGKEYKDLDIGMYLPDGFRFDSSGPVMIINTQPAFSSMIWTSFKCLSTYNMGYSVSYPVIIRVKDTLSGHYFNFASLVFVERTNDQTFMRPGKCEMLVPGMGSCSSVDCYAKIEIVDEAGSPLGGVSATYGGCYMGASDASGIIEGKIRCGDNELVLFKNSSYDFFTQNVSSNSINNTYTLRAIREFTGHFRKIAMTEECASMDIFGILTRTTYPACSQDCQGTWSIKKCIVDNVTDFSQIELYGNGKQYMISNIDSSNLDISCNETQDCKDCLSTHNLASCSACVSNCIKGTVDGVDVEYVPTNNYIVNSSMTSLNSMRETGGSISNGFIGSQQVLFFNIPQATTTDFRISQVMKLCLSERMEECQIEPISESVPESVVSTACTCAGLQAILPDLSCDGKQEILNLFYTCPTPCGSDSEPACSTCCNSTDQIKGMILQKCHMKVLCQ